MNKNEFLDLSIRAKMAFLSKWAEKFFCNNKDEYITITINPDGPEMDDKHFMQVWFDVYNEDSYVRHAGSIPEKQTAGFISEKFELDNALNELFDYLEAEEEIRVSKNKPDLSGATEWACMLMFDG